MERYHFLSPLWLEKNCGINSSAAIAISDAYVTMEALEEVKEEDILIKVPYLTVSIDAARCIKSRVIDEMDRLRRSN